MGQKNKSNRVVIGRTSLQCAPPFLYSNSLEDTMNTHSKEHRAGAGKTACKYCGQKNCDYSCDESQAGGFSPVDTFTSEQLTGLSWQQIVKHTTPRKQTNVEVTWALDHFRITVTSNVTKFRKSYKAHFVRTAVATANRLLRSYARHEI